MLDFVFRPLRSVLGAAEHEVVQETPLPETEEHIRNAVEAIRQTTASIEHHVEVIESLAISVGPLTNSVNELTATMNNLVALMAPMGDAEHGIRRLEHFFGGHHHEQGGPEAPKPAEREDSGGPDRSAAETDQ
jgi:hypothetical protein